MNAPEPSLSPSRYLVIATTVAATAATVIVLVALVLCFLYRFYKSRKRWRSRYQSSFRREAVHNRPSVELWQEHAMLHGMIVDENALGYRCLTKAGQTNSSFSKVWNDPIGNDQKSSDKGFDFDKAFASNGNQESSRKKPGHLEAIPEGVEMVQDPKSHSPEISMSPPPRPPKMIPKLPSLPTQDRVKPSPPAHPIKVGFSVPKPPSILPRKESRSSENENDFRFNVDLIEELFEINGPGEGKQMSLPSEQSNSNPDAPIFILDPRKSQNTAVVLKSLVNSGKEILDAITEGRELAFDTLEKLTKIAPTAEEAASILQFGGNQMKLADAESFLYYILKAVPSAFIRLKAMLLKANYDPKILQLKESLQTLELACKELRSRGILFKLLETVLKAGNMMNDGTTRSNAHGFDLTALLNLSNVKSPDGKSSVLHFIVEQVARFEGKYLADLSKGLTDIYAENKKASEDLRNENKQETEKQYLTLGLPRVRCIRTELSNCKKSATIDYDSFINMYSSLTARISEIQRVLLQCGNKDKDGFSRVMKGFLKDCNEELKVVREEQNRVMALVKRTTEYYQVGDTKETGAKPLQLFVIVNNFMDMVDLVCIDITRKSQRPNVRNGLSTPRTPFQNLVTYFKQIKEGDF